MKLFKKSFSFLLLISVLCTASACSGNSGESGNTANETTNSSNASDETNLGSGLAIDTGKWQYDETNHVYYQMNIAYCTNPMDVTNETMGIYIPGAYVNATANGDGTYTIAIDQSGEINNYTAETAPIVFPVNTPGYSAQAAPTQYSYNDISSYMDEGFIYVWAGLRGRAQTIGQSNTSETAGTDDYIGGAPWGVTDLKAAIRYYRLNTDSLPGNTDSIFTFGMSGGGAQSAVAGATGDSELYYDYLEAIGAAMYDANGDRISDAVLGAMAWCPITNLDYADEAYEWNMGQFFDTDSRADTAWSSALSDDLAASFAEYINHLGLKDSGGSLLTLTQSESGIYMAGSYYEYLLSVVEGSLNNFLTDTTFPYTPSNSFMAGMPTGGGDGGFPGGDNAGGADGGGDQTKDTVTYATIQEYINSLNADGEWIGYDADTNTAEITSLEAFIVHSKKASKSVGAFDDINRSQAENNVFGIESTSSLHFDSIIAELLKTNEAEYAEYSDWDSSLISAYSDDLKQVDSLGNDIAYRMNMYNPMYFLEDYYEGYNTSTPAAYWRIRTGITQGDTALTTETNLALALKANSNVKNVDFETVWGEGHTMAERTGDSTENFITWINECIAQQ